MILKHRDRELLRFEWREPEGVRIVSVNDAERKFLPLEMKGEATDESLWRWIARRTVPRGRRFIQAALTKLGINPRQISRIVDFSRGLSLNDVYWMVDDSFDGAWTDYNLYDNEFSADVAVLALTGGGYPPMEKHTSTPEFSTNGMLRKCWRRVDGRIELYKGGTEGAINANYEPYSEYYAAQIAAALGLSHVDYGLSRYKECLCSTCPLFTSDKYSYVPAGRLVEVEEALADVRFRNIFFFDAIILNTDRHLGNFGYLVDNDTNEIVGAAPIFDNGYGLFSLATWDPSRPDYHEFDDLSKYIRRVHPALYEKWLGFPGGLTDEMKDRLSALRGFRFKRHHYYNLVDERIKVIEDFLYRRVSQMLEYGEESDSLMLISRKSGGVNLVERSESGGVNSFFNADESLGLQIKANLQADPFVTSKELSEILNIPLRTIERKMKALREAGQIRRVGAAKNGHWEVNE